MIPMSKTMEKSMRALQRTPEYLDLLAFVVEQYRRAVSGSLRNEPLAALDAFEFVVSTMMHGMVDAGS
jgi:hypothetical protein